MELLLLQLLLPLPQFLEDPGHVPDHPVLVGPDQPLQGAGHRDNVIRFLVRVVHHGPQREILGPLLSHQFEIDQRVVIELRVEEEDPFLVVEFLFDQEALELGGIEDPLSRLDLAVDRQHPGELEEAAKVG